MANPPRLRSDTRLESRYRALADARSDIVGEVVRLFAAARAFALPPGQERAPPRRADLDPALSLALRFMAEQDMLPRSLTLDDVWDGLPAGIP